MLVEEPAQVARANAEARGEVVDVTAIPVEGAGIDQAQRAGDGRRRAKPRRRAGRGLRAAAPAGAEPRLLRGRRAGEEAGVLELRRSRGTDGPAVDPRRRHGREESAVEASVPAQDGGVAALAIQFHVHRYNRRGPSGLAIFGHGLESRAGRGFPVAAGRLRQLEDDPRDRRVVADGEDLRLGRIGDAGVVDPTLHFVQPAMIR